MPEDLLIRCPFCGDKPGGSHVHLSVNLDKKVYYCYFCGRGGKTSELVRIIPELSVKLGIPGLFAKRNSGPAEPMDLFLTPVGSTKTPEAERARRFLIFRGLTPEHIRIYKPGLLRSLPNRVVFPHMVGTDVAFWSARGLTKNTKPKWIFPTVGQTILTKREAVWNLDRLTVLREKTIWICEGVFDAIACTGVAVFGKVPSPVQIRKILETRPEHLVIAFDRDALADAGKLQVQLRGIVRTSVRPPVAMKDYGEYLQVGRVRKIHEEFT